MIKQNIGLATIALALAITLGAAPVSAVEVEEIDCVSDPTNAACAVTTNDEYATMPISETGETMPINDKPTQESNSDKPAGPISDHDYPEEEIEITDTEEEEESESALWPMYLSLGALGLAFLVFIILNLFGAKKKR